MPDASNLLYGARKDTGFQSNLEDGMRILEGRDTGDMDHRLKVGWSLGSVLSAPAKMWVMERQDCHDGFRLFCWQKVAGAR